MREEQRGTATKKMILSDSHYEGFNATLLYHKGDDCLRLVLRHAEEDQIWDLDIPLNDPECELTTRE